MHNSPHAGLLIYIRNKNGDKMHNSPHAGLLIYIRNKNGDKTPPCRTPFNTEKQAE